MIERPCKYHVRFTSATPAERGAAATPACHTRPVTIDNPGTTPLNVGCLCSPIRLTASIHSFCGCRGRRPELTDAALPCSYRLWLAHCGMAVSYDRDRWSFRKRSYPS